jgi:membrane AbrB-like protein
VSKQPKQLEKLIRILFTLLVACCGGILFVWLHIPVPWFLGPMAAVLIGSKFSRIPLYWPSKIRDIGMAIVGYSLGLSFTKSALHQILIQFPSIMLMTIILIAISSFIALIVSKLSRIDYPTILTGSIPGGLSQMIMLAEETIGIDVTVVTVLQVTRQMMIILLVPLYIFNPFFGVEPSVLTNIHHSEMAQWVTLYPNILLFAVVSILCAIFGKKIKLPTSFLVGPIIGTAALTIFGIHGPSLPPSILDISQFMIGAYVGLLIKPDKLPHKGKILSLAVISGFCLLLTSLGLSFLLKLCYGASYSTSYLSLAPGGMDQMGILAHEVNANLSMVVGYQLFRLFFIFLVVPPILKLVFKKLLIKSNTSLPK